MNATQKPTVLCFSGLDSTGGAGIQADIEAIAYHGAHALPIITANTVQNTHNVIRFECINPDLITEQAETILNDISVNVIKIGMLGNSSVALSVAKIIQQYPEIPVVFDPVLAAGGGTELASKELISTIRQHLLPHTHILTPNTHEAIKLYSQSTDIEQAAHDLNAQGAEYVLLTGTHSNSKDIHHRLFHKQSEIKTFSNKRLDNEYHGSGCTLAASIAALIAKSTDTITACEKALDYTYKTLLQAHSPGTGQKIPNRCQ